MDYESKMHPEKNVKVKEVITTLLKLLSAVGIGPVPTAETFRRAKFNKTEAAQDLWRLLNTLLMKVFVQDHECKEAAYPDLDSQFRFVSSALWHSGYRGWWVAGPRACGSRHEVGSRDLLLAFGWVMASGNLLVSLLGEKGLELELLSSAKGMHGLEDLALDLCACGMDGASCRQDVRTLQWQYGKLRLQWRSLIATQQEQAKLTHKVFSNLGSSSISEASVVDIPDIPRSTALDKDLEHIQCLNGILEAYLEWNVVEPLFWCWMDSVIDGCLSERCIEGSNDMPQGTETVTHSCSHVNKARRSVRHLDKMLLRLQTELRRVEPTRRALTQGRHAVAAQLSHEQKGRVEKRVATCLQGLFQAHAPTATSRGFIPYLHGPQVSRSTHQSQSSDPGQAVASGMLWASAAIRELGERKAVLEWELELLRHSQRKEMEVSASTQEGLLLVPPLKR
ncbi:tubulin epsilon and delta complex protein 1 [Electrophorus electricus]|uniref:tubulin epsilon and delta complex protein 1 n=1 Tax=Electrophorus electricus TaxID=8005 RepID=UPI0015D06714|nr:tubulin epsilon and delta complex protein 1 [Electrophorus electricus]